MDCRDSERDELLTSMAGRPCYDNITRFFPFFVNNTDLPLASNNFGYRYIAITPHVLIFLKDLIFIILFHLDI